MACTITPNLSLKLGCLLQRMQNRWVEPGNRASAGNLHEVLLDFVENLEVCCLAQVMDSSLVMELQQAFDLQAQLSKQQLFFSDIAPFPVVSLEEENFQDRDQLTAALALDPFDHLCMELDGLDFHPARIEQEMNVSSAPGTCLEDDGEIPVDPVLEYISDMLMDEDMEDRRCMFVDNSAYRAMTDELACLLGDHSAAADYDPRGSVAGAEISVSPYADHHDCAADSVGLNDSYGGLYDEILKDPMTEVMAELLESDLQPRDRVFDLFGKDDDSVADNRSISSIISYDHRLPLDQEASGERSIKPLRGGYGESYGLLQSDSHSHSHRQSSVTAITQPLHSYGALETKEISPLWRARSLPSPAFDQFHDSQSAGPRSIATPAMAASASPPNARGELFKLLQKSVASHVGKAKQKEGEGRSTISLGGKRLQGSASFKEGTAGMYFQPKTRTLISAGYGGGAGLWVQAADRNLEENGAGDGDGDGDHAAAEAAAEEGTKYSSDVIILLTSCAQAMAGKNTEQANKIVRQVRKLTSPFGDGRQRVAHYFLEALVARISGTGASLYTALNNDRRYSAAEMLKAYHLRIERCPFIRISHFFSNQTIATACDGHSRLHVIDYGILYGFHLPSLIHTLATRHGGPPRVRITGIDFPQPGIKPSQRVEETGRRLSEYARSCGVELEYHAVAASRWEEIPAASLFLRHDEILAVNCMFRLRHLLDETVMAESQRKKLFARIRGMQPRVFVAAVVSAGYNAPFSFMARFQEALDHFANVYDAIDSCVTRDHPDRRLLEQEIFGREILNVVACEGLERVERAESYRHWQWRMQKAGLQILPLDRSICNKSKLLMQQYHPEYCLAEDGGWLMVGWKGRYSRCVSAWTVPSPAPPSPSPYHTP